MNATCTKRMETLRRDFSDTLKRGTFADLPADEFGITPDIRLQWGIDSIIYIIGIGYGFGDNLDNVAYKDENQMMLATCYNIEAQSNDPYVAEGIYNIKWLLTILGDLAYTPDVMDKLYYQSVRALILERMVMEYNARYEKANKEAKRLTMLLNQVADAVEKQARQTH